MFFSLLLLLMGSAVSPEDITTEIPHLSCYVCSGYDCLAQPRFIKGCASPETTECFIVTANNTEIIRGCFEAADPFKWLCDDHIFNKCIVCNTKLCNDQPPTRPETIACYKCSPPSARCRSELLRKIHFKLCRPFLYTDMPACYSIYDHRTLEYEFGCTNEATEQVRAICDQDWFHLTCRLCYSSRCNVELFYKERDGDLQCHGRNNVQRTCPYRASNRPYYACYIESGPEVLDKGCTSERFAFGGIKDWMKLMRIGVPDDRMGICLSDNCNQVQWENRTQCYHNPLRSCVLFYNRLNYCMAIPTDQEGVFVGACEDRYPCWKPELCLHYKCQLGKTLANGTVISCLDDTWTDHYYCYSCEDCPVTSHNYISNVVECPAAGCAEWLGEKGTLSRGCANADEFVKLCTGEGAVKGNVCRSCTGNYCNYEQYGFECIQCTYDNQLCTYDPMNTWHRRCDLPITNVSRFGCFSRKRVDGLVERGCFDGETVDCDVRSECTTCRGNHCNNDMFLKSSCISCTTDLNGECATDFAYLSNKTDVDAACPILYNVPLCYTIFGPLMVERGCTAKLYTPIYDRECGPKLLCHFCDTELCNYWRQVPEGFRLTMELGESGGFRVQFWTFLWWLGWFNLLARFK